jgi:uncharacterized protein
LKKITQISKRKADTPLKVPFAKTLDIQNSGGFSMKPSLSVITLGVNNFGRSLDFYKKGLKWSTKAKKKDNIAFFKLNGVVLALYDKKALAQDATVGGEGSGFPGITLAHNVQSELEVDETLKEVQTLGAKIVKKAQKASWGGYSGYFADLDGYLWEVVYNPFWKLTKKGSVVLP